MTSRWKADITARSKASNSSGVAGRSSMARGVPVDGRGEACPMSTPSVEDTAQAVAAPAPHDHDLLGGVYRRWPLRRQRRGHEQDRAGGRRLLSADRVLVVLIMRMLGEMAVATRRSGRSRVRRTALGHAPASHRLAVLVVLGDRPRHRGSPARRSCSAGCRRAGVGDEPRGHAAAHRHEPRLGQSDGEFEFWFAIDQGRRHHRLHRHRRRLPARHRCRRLARPEQPHRPGRFRARGRGDDPLGRGHRDLRLRRRRDRDHRRGGVRRAERAVARATNQVVGRVLVFYVLRSS